jgi:hypothetical protein
VRLGGVALPKCVGESTPVFSQIAAVRNALKFPVGADQHAEVGGCAGNARVVENTEVPAIAIEGEFFREYERAVTKEVGIGLDLCHATAIGRPARPSESPP